MISKQTIVGSLDTEELNEYRSLQARRAAFEANSEKYSKDDGEAIYMQSYRFWGRIIVQHGIEAQKDFRCDANSGLIWYQESD